MKNDLRLHSKTVVAVIMILMVPLFTSAVHSQSQPDTSKITPVKNSSMWSLTIPQTIVENGDSTSPTMPSIRAALMVKSERLDSLVFRISADQGNSLSALSWRDGKSRADHFQLGLSTSLYWREHFQNLVREKLLKQEQLPPSAIDRVLEY